MILKENETVNVVGGASIVTAALITSLTKVISAIYTYGQNLGSSIYKLIKRRA